MSRERWRSPVIRIPKEYLFHRDELGPVKEDWVVEVKPISDQWLVKQANTNDITRQVRRRLETIEQELVVEDVDELNSFHLQYGIERPIGKYLRRFLAYVELLDEYRCLEEPSEKKIEAAEEDYLKQKQELEAKMRRADGTLPGKYYNQLGQIRKQSDTKEEPHRLAKEQAEAMTSFILRKFVLEWLTSGDKVDQLPKLLTQANYLLRSSLNTGNENFRARQPVNYFSQRLSRYLHETRDPGLFKMYRYRKSPDIIRTRSDTYVLRSMLAFLLDPDSVTEDGESRSALLRIAEGYFNFLYNRIPIGTKEDYPNLGLIYDILLAASLKGETEHIGTIADFIIGGYYGSSSEFVRLESELKTLASNLVSEWYSAFHSSGSLAYQTYMLEKGGYGIDPGLVPQQILHCIGTSKRIIREGLRATGNILSESEKPAKGHRVIKRINRVLTEFVRRAVPRKVPVNEFDLFDEFVRKSLRMLSSDKTERFLGIDCSLALELSALHPKQAEMTSQLTKAEKLEIVQEIERKSQEYPEDIYQLPILRSYLGCFWQETQNEVRRVLLENRFLWEQILDNPTWFISPRGDQFSEKDDLEFQEHAIDWLTFKTDRNFPREHLVSIKITGLEQQLQFWLDTRKELLDSNHKLLLVEPNSKQRFLNLILKRLYFITSGASAQEPQIAGLVTGVQRVVEYRRPCYVLLHSTLERPITLKSPGAIFHAEEIKEDYGIDIYGFNDLQHAQGILEQDEWKTYRRGTEPSNPGALALPNRIPYDPTKIYIPTFQL